jgi:hypothetical protein
METWITVTVIALLLIVMFTISFFVREAAQKRGQVTPLDAGQRRHKRDAGVLWVLILVATVYSGLLRTLRTLTGISMLDGSIGVALGLYICAHPAANGVNMLFFERDTLRHLSEWSVIRWLALNLVVLLAGWMVIFLGLTRIVDGAASSRMALLA